MRPAHWLGLFVGLLGWAAIVLLWATGPSHCTPAGPVGPHRLSVGEPMSAHVHRADVPTDFCDAYQGVDCYRCHVYVGRHRADVTS